jgi:ADP-heptose:LPS heptosyltransferase
MPSGSENWAGEFGLRELARRQRGAALFLSGDTGPYHLAAAVGCPTVTLFAPRDRGSSIEACGPYGVDERFHAALQTAAFNDPIESIPLDTVLQKSMEVLGNSISTK